MFSFTVVPEVPTLQLCSNKILNRIIGGVSVLVLIALFLPWTQNISGTGSVTTLKPDQRPQTVHNAIAGRIEKWFVQEGDYVKKGEIIATIANQSKVEAVLNVDENSIVKVKLGQTVFVQLNTTYTAPNRLSLKTWEREEGRDVK